MRLFRKKGLNFLLCRGERTSLSNWQESEGCEKVTPDNCQKKKNSKLPIRGREGEFKNSSGGRTRSGRGSVGVFTERRGGGAGRGVLGYDIPF